MSSKAQEIGSIIRFHRKQAGLTQLDLANLSAVGKSAVFDIEKGKATLRLDTILKICEALNLTIALSGPLMAAWRAQAESVKKLTS